MAFQKTCPMCLKSFWTSFKTQKCCSKSCGRASTVPMTDEQIRARFVKYANIPDDPNACWIWSRSLTESGYGKVTVRRKTMLASHLAYELYVGPIPPGMFILHDPIHCYSRACVNPRHLRCGTKKDNSHDSIIAGTKIRGVKHYKARLNDETVREIRRLYCEEHVSYEQLAEKYGVTPSAIRSAVKFLRWTHIDPDSYTPPPDNTDKLSDDDVQIIRRLREQGCKLRVIAARFNVSTGYVSYLCIHSQNNGKRTSKTSSLMHLPVREQGITDDDVRAIRKLRMEKLTYRQIAASFPYRISIAQIASICKRTCRADVH